MTISSQALQRVLFRVFVVAEGIVFGLALYWIWAPSVPERDLPEKVHTSAMFVGAACLLTMSAVRIKSDTSDR